MSPRFTRSYRLACAAIFLLAAASGSATAQEGSAKLLSNNDLSTPLAAKTLTVTGKVSDDGRSLLTDLDTEWMVSNVESFKGHEGSLVTVKCYVDPDRSQLHVLSIRSTSPEVKHISRLGDSAFRR